MESLACLDSSVLIEYFRKVNKPQTFLARLSLKYNFVIRSIVHFEILCGATNAQKNFWEAIFSELLILPFTQFTSESAISIYRRLKQEGKNIDFKDLAIAAIALHHNFPLATLNDKHFIDIPGLKLITSKSL